MKLADAARTNDELVDGGTPLGEIVEQLGHTLEELQHVAEQRALRAVVYQFRGQDGLDGLVRDGLVALGHTERQAALLYASMYLDGIAIGLRAAGSA